MAFEGFLENSQLEKDSKLGFDDHLHLWPTP
jgi:hypothetical protein